MVLETIILVSLTAAQDIVLDESQSLVFSHSLSLSIWLAKALLL